ncbi:YjbH domain-containing protein [Paracraurococcus lichenis]|uniref:YjbH domain-containing protein n=1 Tax=Paracraurococcus lichenis TaxID=3064888 RepID=A0ABT9E658_9PROT|nr:YjbH domain-containing protein [Paracraurococcus sp. LOR1-02]MDO9711664.1 YjbH domain-containing protein [Paracraurococcus sp. LOR1-02]
MGSGEGSALPGWLALCLVLSTGALAQEVPATGSDYGGAGLVEMRNARFRPDATLEAGAALRRQRQFWFLSFQALPFLETTFRLTDRLDGTRGWGTTNDRAFDLKLRLWEEGPWRPALAVGLQDAAGTGIYGGEYVVASKRFGPLDLTLGMGWGRLGTGADLPNPLGRRPRRRDVGQGGTPAFGSWFRGEDVALFGGVEWSLPALPTPFGDMEGLRLKAEWSGDALRDERGGYPARSTDLRGEARSRLNLGLQWQPNDWLDVGAHFVHGTDALLRVSLRMDPARPPAAPRRAPPPMAARPETGSEAALAGALVGAGFRPLGIEVAGAEARIAVEGGRFPTLAQVAGRVVRAAQPHLPPEVERIEVAWHRFGAPVARLVVLREAMEGAAAGLGSAEEVLATSSLQAARPAGPGLAAPGLAWAIEPRVALQLGDPGAGVRWQAGVVAGARHGLGEGFALAGSLAQAVAGNLDEGRPSDSRLPHVRSDIARYAREGKTSLPTLYAERIWALAPDWFARVTGGLLEPMFQGVQGEVLWRPHDRPLALGIDLAWVAQRDYHGGFGALGYSVATGHASLYADLPVWNLYTVLRAGRYLAGDWGGTIEVGRRFESGIEVGAFATLTDVPFRRFGEGSFDKGIFLRIPLQLLGPETAARAGAVIRPVIRDGGQRLVVDNPLWEVTREGRVDALARGYMGFLR